MKTVRIRLRERQTAIGLLVAAMVVLGPSTLAAPPIPPTPAPIDDLIYARPFVLEQGFEFKWANEHPLVTEGMILVIDVDRDLVYPREAAEPVLYVGTVSGQRITRGYPAGRLIILVPRVVQLTFEPIWFGEPNLPEQIDPGEAQRQRALADEAGIEPFDEATVEAALASGGEVLSVATYTDLVREMETLFLEYIVPLLPENPSRLE